MKGPIDLVTWTYNSSGTLDRCLESIEKAIPEESIHCKIAVDGNSRDRTREILSAHGWQVVQMDRGNIPKQANTALSMVDTPYYASFEHDVILNPDWFKKVYPAILDDPKIAVVQGIRVNKGSRLLEALDARFSIEKHTPVWFYSIDNNIYRTDLIRKVGGYPYDDPFSADGFLRKRLVDIGYGWKVEPVISLHLKDSFWQLMRNQAKTYATSKILYESYSTKGDTKRLLGFVALPLIGGKIAAFAHAPSAFPGYVLMKYTKVLSKGLYLIVHGKKRIHIRRFRDGGEIPR